MGISPSGALDRAAWRRANWLVGNPGHLPALEITAGGFRARICAPMVVALTGAPCPVMVTRADGAHFTASTEAPLALEAGDQLRLGAPARGVRSYGTPWRLGRYTTTGQCLTRHAGTSWPGTVTGWG